MKLSKEQLKKRISVASKQIPAELVIKNGKIVDVFNLKIIYGDVAITDGFIVGIGEYEGTEIIDANQKYIVPGFIDGHVHIESTMITPTEYAKVILPHGVTTVITDPHEIANVAGISGISYMLNDSENLPLDIFFMLPSSVPATSFENTGAKLLAEDLAPYFYHPRVLGLAEVMDYPSVFNNDNEMLDKLFTTLNYSGVIDGHASGLTGEEINIYRAAGIRTDHEAVSLDDAIERLKRGMYLQIRQGSAAKDLQALIPAVNEINVRRCLFCTDDKHLDEIINEGSIDYNVSLAIDMGLNPLLAIQIATLNAAECYGLKTKGAIAPGFEADILLIESLQSLNISKVIKAGRVVAENGNCIIDINKFTKLEDKLLDSVKTTKITAKELQIHMKNNKKAHIIGINPNSLITNKLIEEVDVKNGYFIPSTEKDQLKLAVIERHKMTGNIGLGIVNGLSLKSGAIASTVAHDSHNIIVAGTNDNDMLVAINKLKDMGGGLVVVDNGCVIASLDLPIAGLISNKDFKTINYKLEEINKALKKLTSVDDFNLFLTLSFLSLPVIPELKLTDLGLFDTTIFKHTDVAVNTPR